MSDIHPNVVRVMEAARERGLEITTKRFPEGTKTAADAAAAIGVSVGQIVKSLVFAVDGEIVESIRRKEVGACRWWRKVFAR
jgi:prolyl-tRNA editing enzyme YbaK/EbsC (Cys-tRNA(Pro) deacylase)